MYAHFEAQTSVLSVFLQSFASKISTSTEESVRLEALPFFRGGGGELEKGRPN